jgi:DNA-binding MarR family transcriptional regulator
MGTIARAVRNLENGGNIRMITDPGNRRAIRLFLTEKGAYAIHLLQGINRERETIITSGLPKEETAVLNSLMHRTTQNSFSILPKDGDPGDERE